MSKWQLDVREALHPLHLHNFIQSRRSDAMERMENDDLTVPHPLVALSSSGKWRRQLDVDGTTPSLYC